MSVMLEEIKNIVFPIALSYGVERVSLFGSYARNEAHPDSDIDLCIDKGAIRDYFMLAGFQRELEEGLGLRVDVLTTGALSKEFLSSIKNEEVELYEKQ
ncbi:MAG: nucleotidyltransferase domain-containing protein [Clostridiales bacterium]|nr:nucleotidyltransferase domain-containing protein [Clostridiales bacterium]